MNTILKNIFHSCIVFVLGTLKILRDLFIYSLVIALSFITCLVLLLWFVLFGIASFSRSLIKKDKII